MNILLLTSVFAFDSFMSNVRSVFGSRCFDCTIYANKVLKIAEGRGLPPEIFTKSANPIQRRGSTARFNIFGRWAGFFQNEFHHNGVVAPSANVIMNSLGYIFLAPGDYGLCSAFITTLAGGYTRVAAKTLHVNNGKGLPDARIAQASGNSANKGRRHLQETVRRIEMSLAETFRRCRREIIPNRSGHIDSSHLASSMEVDGEESIVIQLGSEFK